MLTFVSQFEWFGANPVPFHLFNIGIHLLNTVLIYRLARPFGAVPWVSAAVFALHPLQTSCATLIYGRPYALGVLFLLLALRHLQRIERTRSHLDYRELTVLGALWVCMVLSKQVFVFFPALAMWLFFLRKHRQNRAISSKYIVPTLGAISLITLFIVVYALPYSRTAHVSPLTFSLSQLGNAYRVLWSMFLIPWRTALLHDLPWYEDVFNLDVLLGIALVGGAIGAAWKYRASPAGHILGAFLIVLTPTNSLFPKDQVVVEWRFYPAMIFFALLIGVAAKQLQNSSMCTKKIATALLLVLLSYYSYSTLLQVRAYRSTEAAYLDTLRLYPESLFALNDLGSYYLQRGDFGASEHYLRRALVVAPSSPTVRRNIHRIIQKNAGMKTIE